MKQFWIAWKLDCKIESTHSNSPTPICIYMALLFDGAGILQCKHSILELSFCETITPMKAFRLQLVSIR